MERIKVSPYSIRLTPEGRYRIYLRLEHGRRAHICTKSTRAEAEEEVRRMEEGEL